MPQRFLDESPELSEQSSPSMTASPIFIVGMNGSGTTMLLDCLSGHSLIFGFAGETKVLPYFISKQRKFGDLTCNENFAALWRSLDRELSLVDWPHGLYEESIEHWGTNPRSVAAIVDFVMLKLAAQQGKAIWCEKTPMHVHHIADLSREFPAARFLHVIRDGRDCAASFHRRWGFNPVRTIYRWKNAVRAGRAQGRPLGSRYHEISYESLTANPTGVLKEVCHFLGVPPEDGLHKLTRHRPEMTGSGHQRVTKNNRNAGQYFDRSTLLEMETISGQCLLEFNYQPTLTSGDDDPTIIRCLYMESGDYIRKGHAILHRAKSIRPAKRLSFLRTRLVSAIAQRISLLR